MKNPVPKVAAIHDLSGYGRGSLTTVIEVLATMGIQPCPLPTAVLSTHTGGFNNYKFIDLTDELQDYINHWESLNIGFDAIYSGFLGSIHQIEIVIDFIKRFKREDQYVIIDPVLGDNGQTYDTFGPKMISKMKTLVKKADLITPNITEAKFLLDKEDVGISNDDEAKEWLKELSSFGPDMVVITSVEGYTNKEKTSVLAYQKKEERFWKVDCDYIPANFPGTGDLFTSILVGSILSGDSLPMAIDRAVQFISMAVRTTYGYDFPEREGVLIERVLANLNLPITGKSYEI
ncbi:MAG TPA: pyridoxamine kinase [Halanaerobiales bacterium]|nr:pyridoxamine kinase [Halanaerobiales bacterium]